MLVATILVGVVPVMVSLWLRALGVISSAWIAMALSLVLSAAASAAGNAFWSKWGSGDVLFSELLLWGWALRRRQERQLSDAAELLGLAGPRAAGADERVDVRHQEQLLRQLAGALEGQDLYLNGHSHRVARHATMIARGMGLPSEEVARIRAAAAVHDVGKLRTPKEILNKPGRLTDEEFEVIKRHSVDGAEMVAVLGDPALTAIVRHHHERLDGGGYPDGLAGDLIPLGARIVAVADTFDAVTSTRAYRGAAPHREALAILRHEAGTQLDPAAVRAFLSYYSGNRLALLWAMAMASVRRVVSWLGGDPAAAATISTGKLAATVAASAAIATSAAAMPVAHLSFLPTIVGAHGESTQSADAASGGQAHARAGTRTGATVPSALVKRAASASLPVRGGALKGLAKAPSTLPGASVTPTVGQQIRGVTRSASGAGTHSTAASTSPGVSSGHPLGTNPATAGNGAPSTGTSTGHHPGAATNPGASHGRGSGAVNSHHANPHSGTGQGKSNAGGQGKSNAGGQGQGSSNAGGQGKSNAGGQGQGNSNAGGQGQGSSNAGGQGQGSSNAGGQGEGGSNAGGQGQGGSNAGGQGQGGSNAGGQGQGSSNAGGQSTSNAGGQGKGNAGG